MNKKKLLIITILFSFILVGCVATKKDNDEEKDTVVSYKCQLVEEDNDTTYLTKIRIYFDEDTITKMEIDKITERTRYVDSLKSIYDDFAKKVNKVKGLEMAVAAIDDYKLKQTLVIDYSKYKKDDMDENTRQVVDEYMKKVVSKAYKSFEIEEVKILEDKASVTAKIVLGYNPEESSGLSDDTLELVSQYQKDHYDELVEIYTEEGEKAMYKKMYNDLIPIIIGKMQEALESSDPSEEKTVLSLVKVDNKWLVSDLEENRPQAANTEAKEEAAAAVSTSAQTEYADEDITSEENTDEGLTADGNAEEGSSAGHTAETGNTSEEAAEAGTTEGETGN